jgi:hypothetical protein
MSTTTLLRALALPFPEASVHYYGEAWWTVRSSAPGKTWRNRSDWLLAPDLPFSVIPAGIARLLDLQLSPPGPGWGGLLPTWFGIPSSLARVTMWLPIEAPLPSLREFSLLALLPRDELTDAPPFIHLGSQFLVEYQGTLLLSGRPPQSGMLLIP